MPCRLQPNIPENRAIDNARAGISWMTDAIAEKEAELREFRARLDQRKADLGALLGASA